MVGEGGERRVQRSNRGWENKVLGVTEKGAVTEGKRGS